MQLRLTKKEVPNGSTILFVSDVHIPVDHRPALEVMISLAESIGVTHVIAGGDIADCHSVSRHPKDVERLLSAGTLREEIEKGQYLINWFSTRPTVFIAGNHEDRINRLIAENPGLYGLTIPDVLGLPKSWVHLPTHGQVRLGNLVISHGDSEFKSGSGGKYPAHKLLEMAPDQSSIIGHLHRIAHARRTSQDEDGIPRTRGAWVNGHMSHEESHYDYVSRHIGWQMGFILIHVWWEDDRPRWDVNQIEVMFDRYNKPYCQYGGKVYRG